MPMNCPQCGSEHVRFDQDVKDGHIFACEECKVIFKIVEHPVVTGACMVVWLRNPQMGV